MKKLVSNNTAYGNYFSVFTHPSKTVLRNFLEDNGWRIRKESWVDFECRNQWSELYLTGEEANPLLNGKIQEPEVNYRRLIALFSTLNEKFTAELYDEDDVLVFEDKII